MTNTKPRPSLMFFDIDGTLFSNQTHHMPGSAVRAIEHARACGHIALINTGRTRAGMQKELWDGPFDGFLQGCGTRIIYHGKTLFERSFPPDVCVKIIDLMEKYDVDTFLEGSEDEYLRRRPYRNEEMNRVKENFLKMGYGTHGWIEDRNFIFDKFILLDDNPEKSQAFLKECSAWIDIIDRGSSGRLKFYECIQKGYNKSTAMHFISERLGIPLTRSYAFGDSTNDRQMLETAAHACAMGVHSPYIEDCVDYITDIVENDGLAKALQHYGLTG